jgi:hypothetical protein
MFIYNAIGNIIVHIDITAMVGRQYETNSEHYWGGAGQKWQIGKNVKRLEFDIHTNFTFIPGLS